jgi:thiamine-monophosphate kinase
MASEFSLIARYFTRPTAHTALGVGDDAALFQPQPGMQLAVSTDMLVAGTHFYPDTDPRRLGWKTLAVNISDLAAMGAQPRWATLALALPAADDAWLAAFAEGFFECANRYEVDLIGGDTTRGPLNLCVTIMGEVPSGQALRRDGAQTGDDIWVSGPLGGAALGLACLQKRVTLEPSASRDCMQLLECPQPRVQLGLALRGLASSAIDISDGLLADLGHVLHRSHVGADIQLVQLPVHPALQPWLPQDWALNCLLTGGDDYELCFTAAPTLRSEIDVAARSLGLAACRIGRISAELGLRLLDATGTSIRTEKNGYDHFA